ncbi:serpin family protein [Oceanirhabdus sp. W0125-5]|uniref:serpin family protein n=1 Tax=Oceanirhabdus sp. W0125-5 TaxID=2999116 RepID=UPI0022F3394A|nr:serpin family protein [Oceanirhabdus sp. W0125-5]WBW98246.1 serpin family protein [Oceanirhabdus sp. W0125-5]
MNKKKSKKASSKYLIIVIALFSISIVYGFIKWDTEKNNVLDIEGIDLIEVNGKVSRLSNDNKAVDSINKLAFEMIKKDQGNNLVISPVSIVSSLSLLTNGANEEGKSELLSYLLSEKTHVEYNQTIQDMNKDFNEYILYMSNHGKNSEIKYGTSIWIDKKYSYDVNEEFINRANNDYYAEVYFEDFKGDTDRSVNKVNKWCNLKTKGKINEIMDKELDDEFFGVILNTLYFNGSWKEPFNNRSTKKKEFLAGTGKKVKVPMMCSKENLEYLENQQFKAIKKGYRGGKYEMTIILPNENIDIDELLNNMDVDSWNEINHGENSFTYDEVIINMPKFKFEYERLLNEDLINSGVKSVFKSTPAGLSDISEEVYLSLIKQKCTIEINESGTEAAAVTSIEMNKSEACEAEKEPKEFIVNRPFIFIISDSKYDSILFIGKVYNPA